MTILEERSWRWQGAGGPAGWEAAWVRTRELLVPVVPDKRFAFQSDPHRGEIADGAAGLATAFYLLTDGSAAAVADVRRDQVEELLRPGAGETDGDVVRRWEERLRALGHEPETGADPVCERWRVLRTDFGWEDDLTVIGEVLVRQGYGLLAGLGSVLADLRGTF
ncbi:hypothetical protein [Kitasatospora sp. NPDC096140]|uniref:hypothetical protein n=1 Tax=Kitasatospora sp. NPDC096140 TaxID=3155425 RepID=UPI00331900E8